MIGIFDSGVGGFNALYELRRIFPLADIIYLADRDNAPYGTKTREELISLIHRDIARLRERGADIILMACCTASTVYTMLSDEEQRICVPIIVPAARMTEGGRTAVIATEATVRSHAFSDEIRKIYRNSAVSEIPAQRLVYEVEHGARTGCLTDEQTRYLDSLCASVSETHCDALVLGCTHFSHVEGEICARLPSVRMISPAREGAHEIARKYSENKAMCQREHGRTVYM